MQKTILRCKTGKFMTCKTGPIVRDKYIKNPMCLNISMVTSDVEVDEL